MYLSAVIVNNSANFIHIVLVDSVGRRVSDHQCG